MVHLILQGGLFLLPDLAALVSGETKQVAYHGWLLGGRFETNSYMHVSISSAVGSRGLVSAVTGASKASI